MKFDKNISLQEALKHFKDGDKIKAVITSERRECEGVITIENNSIFICQNIYSGDRCNDKKGFKYSYRWSQFISSIEHIETNEVINTYDIW